LLRGGGGGRGHTIYPGLDKVGILDLLDGLTEEVAGHVHFFKEERDLCSAVLRCGRMQG
jgi:hypothetical protein